MNKHSYVATVRSLLFAFIPLTAPTLTWAASVTGSPNNDILIFQWSLGQFTTTITNAYSGATISFDEQKNLNTATYDGLAGIDTLVMTNLDDVLLIEDGLGQQTSTSVERILAGAGNDVINLSSTLFVLGDQQINAGGSDDIIWSNAGNDSLRGETGFDIIDGGPGDDHIWGGTENDSLFGGTGNDILEGEDGLDTYFYQAGGGIDSIFDTGATIIWFTGGITAGQLIQSQSGNDLVIDTDGTGLNTLTVHDYYLDPGIQLDLEFAVSTVPVPAAVWLFGSGLIGLLGMAKRRC